MLAAAGLSPSDVTYVAKGATGLRYRALLDGAFDATLLTPPYNARANEKGFRTLGRAIDVFHHYVGIVGIARRSWLAAHRPTALAYLRAYRAALTALGSDRAGGSHVDRARCESHAGRGANDVRRDVRVGIRFSTHLRDRRRRRSHRVAPPRSVRTAGCGTDPIRFVDTSLLRALA